MHRRSAIIIPALLCLAFSLPASSQVTLITLEDALRLAKERNIDVVQARNNIDAADANVQAAYGDYLPSLSANGGWNWNQTSRSANQQVSVPGIGLIETQQEVFDANDRWSSGLNASYNLFDGLRREATVASTEARRTVAERSSERTCQAVSYEVISTYLNILRTERLVKVGEENLKRDQRQLERITESSRVGALPLADVYRQQSQVANDELDLITAQNNHDKAKADLTALIGLDLTREYEFRDPSLTAEIDPAKVSATMEQYRNVAGVTQRALGARPDLVAARASLDAAGASVTAAQSSYFPALDLTGGYGNSSDELGQMALNRNYNLSAGVGLRWNLFDGFAREASVEQAKVTQRNAEVQLSQYEKNVAVEVRKAFLDLEAAKKSWDVSEKVLVSAAEDRRIAEERYNLGAGTLLDLLVANATYVNAQAARVNSVAGFLNARYNMEFAVGDRTCEGPREH